ncbi:hydantoinase/oxoprolinase family protein [Silicimonas algicola]|uniref:N-methylhydantoinase A n=1 Tax=Silicimonas algicola TaxID=1826607 RepID=A0A316GAG1_9RHOB|nr:hydantoinase/oxoprolinase family protein [Silicimonas algicola]AZQ67724.1 hydantoinase/oxoprolinase family protein [Silicimonas algicola]PWK57868.1 N-methylhydantoinase A [Silicimonas algicola]
MIRCGVDIGGTFTDVVLDHPGGRATTKVLTDYARPEDAILEGIRLTADAAGVALSDLGQVIHGTTLVTNALIQRSGPRMAFVTTEGFRDVIEMRSENRFEQYDLNLRLPEPLVPRKDRFTLSERMSPQGDVLRPLDPDAVEALVRDIAAKDYATVAVGFLHSYANDAHERVVYEFFSRIAPDLPVSISSRVSPQMRELPRFNTVIANAYVRPQVAAYLDRLVTRLREAGTDAPVYMMHSGGGLISVETAAEEPVRLLESGPAGGAIFAAGYARAHGIGRALSFDMGGTTAKICLIEDGAPKTASSFEIARTWRFKKGSGMTVSTPVVEMVEIGAGGGSIASIDALGRIQVGPRSAGSEPGPACYQRGGQHPTVTDANLTLGRLDPEAFAGGKIPLSTEAAERALAAHVGQAQGLGPADAAFGVTEMVDEQMANAARVHAVENGREIEDFTMIAFGGGAPLHAARLAEKLGIAAVLVPPGAGVGSAIGFLEAPVSYETARGLFQRLDTFDAGTVNAALETMEAEARRFVEAGAQGQATETRLVAHMRYSGQGWEIPVLLDSRVFGEDAPAKLRAAFEEAYRTLFGRIIEGLAVEVANWTLSVATPKPPRAAVTRRETGRKAEGKARRFLDAALRAHVDAAEVARADLSPGDRVDGPAIVTEDETSTIVTSAFTCIAQDDGSLLLIRKDRT